MDTGHMLAMATCEYTKFKWGSGTERFLAGSTISSTRTSFASVYYGGSCSTARGRQLSKCSYSLDHFPLTACFQVYSSTLTCCSGILSGHYAL